jgi:predicted Zn-dependent peptidase
MIRRTLAASLAALSLTVTPIAAGAQSFPTKMPAAGTMKPFKVPASETFRLPNGMQVTLIPYGITPTTVVSLRVYAGALNQGDNVALPTLTAQMLREGAGGRTGAQLAEAAASMGGNLGVGAGAHETSVTLNVLSEYAADAIRLVADVVRRPDFPASELDRTKQGILRNLAIARSQPGALAEVALASAYYGDKHPYGRLYPTEAQLKAYTVDDLRRFYAANFGAQRARLYVSGRFDTAAVRAAIQQAYADWQPGPERLKLPPQPKAGPQVILVDRPGAAQTTLRLAFPAPVAGSAEDIPMRVSNALLGGGFSSRITKNIREAKGYTYSPGSNTAFNVGEARWTFNADVTTDVTGASLKEVFHEIRRMQTEAIAEEEASRTRNYLAGTFVLSNASPFGLINTVATRDLHGLPANWLDAYVPSVLSVSNSAMQQSVKQALPLERLTLVAVGDLAKITPQLKALPELKGAEFKTVRPFD